MVKGDRVTVRENAGLYMPITLGRSTVVSIIAKLDGRTGTVLRMSNDSLEPVNLTTVQFDAEWIGRCTIPSDVLILANGT